MDFLTLLALTVVAAVAFAVVLWIAMARIVGRAFDNLFTWVVETFGRDEGGGS
jgi:hypothetical protein